MTDPSPADELRAAADKLRALATTPGITPGPWRHDPDTSWNQSPFFGQEYVGAGPAREIECVAGTGPESEPHAVANAVYIAAMHPGVGVALARWLSVEALTWAGDEVHSECSPTTCTLDAALTVARAILAGQAPQDGPERPHEPAPTDTKEQ